MTFSVDYRDVELFVSASNGFKELYDEDGNESYKSKLKTNEDFQQAYEWSDSLLNKIYKVVSLDELKKVIPTNVPYSLEIEDDEIVFIWSCPNRVWGKFTFGYKISYANIS